MLDWPYLSPDMPPIEHAWDELARRISTRRQSPRNINELTNALISEWDNISQQVMANLVLLMRQRCMYCMHSGKWQLHSLLIAFLNVRVLIFDRLSLLHYSIFWDEI